LSKLPVNYSAREIPSQLSPNLFTADIWTPWMRAIIFQSQAPCIHVVHKNCITLRTFNVEFVCAHFLSAKQHKLSHWNPYVEVVCLVWYVSNICTYWLCVDVPDATTTPNVICYWELNYSGKLVPSKKFLGNCSLLDNSLEPRPVTGRITDSWEVSWCQWLDELLQAHSHTAHYGCHQHIIIQSCLGRSENLVFSTCKLGQVLLYRIQRKWAAAVVIHVPDAILIPPCRTVLTQSLGPFFHMQTANCCPGTSRCAQTISNEWVLMWNMSQLAHRHQAASLVPSLLWQQGVVTYTSPVEAFAIGVKNLDRRKSSLIAWSLRSKTLDRLILREFKGQNVATPAKYLRKCVDRLILVAQNSSWSLDRLLKRTLIAWFHFDPGRKRFYRRRLCDYPLQHDQ